MKLTRGFDSRSPEDAVTQMPKFSTSRMLLIMMTWSLDGLSHCPPRNILDYISGIRSCTLATESQRTPVSKVDEMCDPMRPIMVVDNRCLGKQTKGIPVDSENNRCIDHLSRPLGYYF